MHGSYEGATGPSYWGDLADDFAACEFGSSQSPINILGEINASLVDIDFEYEATPLSILNNGHTIQANYKPGSAITIGHEEYDLRQFHFHRPSEHTVNGKQCLMEGHLAHQDAQGNLGALGASMERGETNPPLAAVWEFMPPTAGPVREPGGSFDVNEHLPGDRTTYRYPGSLTTPPCSESVQWMIPKNPAPLSAERAQVFQDTIGYNSRYNQSLHGREVLGDISAG